MFGRTWKHRTLRKYIIYFGTLFDNVYITRENNTGETVSTMKVPLNYGPKEKYLARLEGNPDLQRPIAITLPRMSFEMTGIMYAPERKIVTTNKIVYIDPVEGVKYQYAPVPYDILFSLSIMVKNAEDGTRIVEQILPYFTPQWTSTLNILPEMDYKLDVPVILNNVSMEDTYEGNFETRRAIIWTLDFTMKGQLFSPTIQPNAGASGNQFNAGLITQAITNVIAQASNEDATTTITVTPGLDANGNPTSNASISIGRDNIKPTDDYGYIIDFESDN